MEELDVGRVRLRRVRSTSLAEEIVTENEKQRRAQPDKPVHRARDSLFSWSSGFQNYEGVMNWAFLLLSIGGLRLFLENFNKYGNRVDPYFWIAAVFGNIIDATGEYPTLYLILYAHITVCLALAFEKLIAGGWVSWTFGFMLHTINIVSLLIVPIIVINAKHEFIGPVSSMPLTLIYVITFFKLWSYMHVNMWARSPEEDPAVENETASSPGIKERSFSECDHRRPRLHNDEDDEQAVLATLVCFLHLIAFLKLFSYAQTNFWCRSHGRNGGDEHHHRPDRKPRTTSFNMNLQTGGNTKHLKFRTGGESKSSNQIVPQEELVQYPDNLNLADIYYFWMAPTLCYELNFPRMRKMRKLFLLRRIMEVIIGTNIVLALVQQWIIPSVVNSLIPFSNMEYFKALERILKLALPNHLIWLIWFYLLFHSFLNTIGELLRFADREFYHDWWNANNILVFWKSWNIPVHRWCVRHLFKPILRSGYSVRAAQVVVFFFSAFFHEYLVSVPLRVFKVYAFSGMVMQVPLISVSKILESEVGPRAGNVCVWLSLIIGQPMAVMMYYHDFVVEHYGSELIGNWGQLNNATTTS